METKKYGVEPGINTSQADHAKVCNTSAAASNDAIQACGAPCPCEGQPSQVSLDADLIYQEIPMNNPIDKFRSVMKATGIVAPAIIVPGTPYRFPTHGGQTGSSAWCQMFLDGQGGVFGDYRTGSFVHWFGCEPKPATPALRRQRAVDLEKIRAETARVQAVYWASAQATNTPLWD